MPLFQTQSTPSIIPLTKASGALDRWQQPGDVATYPRLSRDYRTYGANTEWINTNLWLHDGTYARLRNVKLSYRVPQNKLKNIKGMTVNVTGTNLITLTNFIGLDPEIARDFENATDRNMSDCQNIEPHRRTGYHHGNCGTTGPSRLEAGRSCRNSGHRHSCL